MFLFYSVPVNSAEGKKLQADWKHCLKYKVNPINTIITINQFTAIYYILCSVYCILCTMKSLCTPDPQIWMIFMCFVVSNIVLEISFVPPISNREDLVFCSVWKASVLKGSSFKFDNQIYRIFYCNTLHQITMTFLQFPLKKFYLSMSYSEYQCKLLLIRKHNVKFLSYLL